MNQSRFDPFKSRLREVFGASSSGDNPYGNPPLPVTPQRKKKKAKPDWEQESEHLFEDFLSLDEEKITQGLAKARVRKAMEKKYGRARLTEETAAMEDTLQVEGVDAEKTQQKRVMARRFVDELHAFLVSRYPDRAQWLDILDPDLWAHLSAEGLAPRFLLNLSIVAYYLQTGLELWQQPRAMMYLHLHARLINLNLTPEMIAQHLEKWTLDPDDFQSLLQQTYHALERHHHAFESYLLKLKPVVDLALSHTLEDLQEPTLNLDTRLGQFYLARRYSRLQQEAQSHVQHHQAKQEIDIQAMHTWMRRVKPRRKLYLRAFALRALAASVLPLDGDALCQFDPLFGKHYSAVQKNKVSTLYAKTLKDFSSRQLKKWARAESTRPDWASDLPEYVSDQVLSQNVLEAINENQLNTLEKWVQFKAYHSHLFRSQCLRPWQEVYQRLRTF